jgi:hypothetical protein
MLKQLLIFEKSKYDLREFPHAISCSNGHELQIEISDYHNMLPGGDYVLSKNKYLNTEGGYSIGETYTIDDELLACDYQYSEFEIYWSE